MHKYLCGSALDVHWNHTKKKKKVSQGGLVWKRRPAQTHVNSKTDLFFFLDADVTALNLSHPYKPESQRQMTNYNNNNNVRQCTSV